MAKRKTGRCLAVDFGLARIGLAISDPGRIISEPLPAISNRDAVREVVAASEERSASEIVVGLPLNMDGTKSDQTRVTLEFVDRLRKATDTPVRTWDERLSTVQAERTLRHGGSRRRKHPKGRVDSAAAAIILDSYLASLR